MMIVEGNAEENAGRTRGRQAAQQQRAGLLTASMAGAGLLRFGTLDPGRQDR